MQRSSLGSEEGLKTWVKMHAIEQVERLSFCRRSGKVRKAKGRQFFLPPRSTVTRVTPSFTGIHPQQQEIQFVCPIRGAQLLDEPHGRENKKSGFVYIATVDEKKRAARGNAATRAARGQKKPDTHNLSLSLSL